MRIKILGVGLTLALLLIVIVPAAGAVPTFSTLQPGGFRTIAQDQTVNIVFVGYEKGSGARDIDQSHFLAGLPDSYETVIREPLLYGLFERMGLQFSYDYNLVYADQSFEDGLFGYMTSIAKAKPLTVFQSDYNSQKARSLDVTDNCWIDAPSVEKWLADNAHDLEVDTTKPTIFFINWYGRSDFKFHVYSKTGEPDPDTGYDFGLNRDSRKLIAWGGTTPDDEETGLGSLHRIWFYDLSAGPESWSDNWNLDDADLDGDDVTDYRMPPVWEYGSDDAYRPFDDLSGDLAKVARYVGIDLLFTTSPLYKPAIFPPRLPQAVQVDINMYQADPESDGKAYVQQGLIRSELGELQPLNAFTTDVDDASFSARAALIYRLWVADTPAYGGRYPGIGFANLFLYHQDHLLEFLDGDSDYEVPLFAYNTTDALGAPGGLLGFADDNWRNGTQSYVFAFDSPETRNVYGYGFSTTIIHETGHHLGMSHPHDGYDSEDDVDFGPSGPYYFVNDGDECNSMMSYIDLNWDFSQFDRDNMARYLTAIYVNEANAILPLVLKSPRAGRVSATLTAADASAGTALTAYADMDYQLAAEMAKAAYDGVRAAAAAISVNIQPRAWPAQYKAKGISPSYVDTLYNHRSQP